MTDRTTALETKLTGRALWDAHHQQHGAYDVLVQDGEAFACAMFDALGTSGFATLTGHLFGGDARKRYDAKRAALYVYLDSHDIDPELRRLIDAMKDEVYDFAGETFNDGIAFATVTARFRARLLGLGPAK